MRIAEVSHYYIEQAKSYLYCGVYHTFPRAQWELRMRTRVRKFWTSEHPSRTRTSVNQSIISRIFLLGRYGTLSCLSIYFHRAQFGGIQQALTIQYLRTAN